MKDITGNVNSECNNGDADFIIDKDTTAAEIQILDRLKSLEESYQSINNKLDQILNNKV